MSKGGGTRRIDIKSSACKEEVIARAKQLFFPGGQSSHGAANEMKFDLANFKLDNISRLTDEEGIRHPFTVQKYFEVHKLNQARIYLTSKRMSTISAVNDETDNSSTQNISSSSSKTNLQHQKDKGKFWRQNYAVADSESNDKEKEDNSVSLRREMEEVQRLEDLRKARESRVPPEPVDNAQRVRVSVSHCLEGNVSRFFPAKESMVAVYDWVGSLSLFPENFCLRLTSGRSVEPTEDVSVVDGSPLVMEITSNPMPMSSPESGISFRGFGFGDYPAPCDVDLSDPFDSVDDLHVACSPPDIIMVGDER